MRKWTNKKQDTIFIVSLIIVFFGVLLWSMIAPKDRFVWFLEVIPAIIAFLVLATTYHTFRFSRFSYIFILIHCIILIIGGHYTYAEVPFFAPWSFLGELFEVSRNNYDKLWHFAQWFIPILVTRELFIRKNIVPTKTWRNFLSICVVVAISALYEMIEWWVAIATGESADAFLGTQGYVWDTQADMMWAMIWWLTFLFFFWKIQDRSIKAITKQK